MLRIDYMVSQEWEKISAKAQEIRSSSIPSEWRIPEEKLPPPEQLDVTGFPAKSSILTDAELAITDSYATEIVSKIAAGEWKAEDVTRAFCKRAVIAHQVVGLEMRHTEWLLMRSDQLLDSHHV